MPTMNRQTFDWRSTWRPVQALEDGARGLGERRGEAGEAKFGSYQPFYPTCSLHGAMQRLSKDTHIWRCMVEGCNVGVQGGSYQDRIEIVYYRYHTAYRRECPTLEDALSAINGIQDYDTGWTLGVFKNGEPLIYGGYVDQDPPDEKQHAAMVEGYAESEEE